MNISNIPNRIEIAFWMGMVSLLRPRRITRLVSWMVLLLLCLLALFLTAFTFVYQAHRTGLLESKSSAIHLARYAGRPENGQYNLLLVLVDELAATQPGLQGVWMVIHHPSGKKVTFMPVYPAETRFGFEVKQIVGVQKETGLSPELEQALEKKGLWWDNYLVIDRAILASLIQQVGGIELGAGHSDGQQVIGLLPIADTNAQTALDLQMRIAQGICQRLDSARQTKDLKAILDALTGADSLQSAHTNLSPPDFFLAWNRLARAGGFVCEFPTMTGR